MHRPLLPPGIFLVLISVIGLVDPMRPDYKSRMRLAEHVARIGEERAVNRVLVEEPVGKTPLGRPGLRWQANIRMDLQEVGCGVWTALGWLRIETGGGHL
jgi:hypothetical protein